MRLVVIGHGMVGARLIDEVRRHDPQGRDIAITVLGAEVHDPYNRVLLSDVVAGRAELGALRLPADNRERVLVLPGTAAVSIDRDERMVQDSDGARHPYDVRGAGHWGRCRDPAHPRAPLESTAGPSGGRHTCAARSR